jgi:eukaryotic-like serine/threonine-protein kinase
VFALSPAALEVIEMDPQRPGKTSSSRQPDPGATQVGDDLGATVVPSESVNKPPSTAGAAKAGTAKPAASKPAEESIPERLGNFKILKKLGQGGMGAVYLAHQENLDRKVALKVMAPQVASRPGFVERFYREARAMAKLDHPNVVRGFDVGEDNGQHYVAMELIDGKSMQDWLNEFKVLTVGDALHVAIKAADALQHAHDLGMIHRDIKPDNMLVTSKGVLKVSDLGLAKQVDEDNSMTQSGTGLGTPYYMPPEQARNAKHVDHRSDIYALGSTLYHFLTGQYPFTGESTLELILSKEKGKFKPACQINKSVPERLSMIIDRSLTKEPKSRQQSMTELIRDLESVGLASRTLSFIPAAEQNPAAQLTSGGRGGAATSAASAPARAPASGVRPAAGAPQAGGVASGTGSSARTGAATAAISSAGATGEPVWYVRYPDETGKLKEAKLSTPQVLQIVKSGQLDLRAKASKVRGGDYLPLAQYTEFEAVVRSRLVKQEADKKGEAFKGLYAKIDREQKWHKWKRYFGGLFSSGMGAVGFVIWLAVIVAVVAGVGWAVLNIGLPWLRAQSFLN